MTMKSVLIIDDSKTQLTSLKLFLIRHGFDVSVAENGIEGYKKVVENPPDVIVCDVLMPNLNGYQFCRLVKNNSYTQKIPVILLTMLNQNIDKFWGDQAGADLFLSKNCELSEILDNINQITKNHPVDGATKNKIINTQALKNALQARVNDVLDTSLMEATIMNEFRKLSKNIEDTTKFLKSFFKILASLFEYNACVIKFNEREFYDKSKIYVSTQSYAYTKECIEKIVKNSGLFNENAEIETIENNNENKEETDNLNFKTRYTLDLEINDEKLAKLCFFNYEKIDYESFQFFEVVKNEMALIAKIRNLYVKTKFLSITDGLTYLYNRRYFFENIEREFERSKRYKSKLSVAMLDIDFLKEINDTYGHQTGDFILKNLSDTITQTLRKTDLIFRYGGEEFIIILPETSLEQAYIPLERLRLKINNAHIEYNDNQLNYTVSIGISEKNDNITTTDELIGCADKALYYAKNTGRNKVALYE